MPGISFPTSTPRWLRMAQPDFFQILGTERLREAGPSAPSLSISTPARPLLVISPPSRHVGSRPGAQPQTCLCLLCPFPSLLSCQLTLGEPTKDRSWWSLTRGPAQSESH